MDEYRLGHISSIMIDERRYEAIGVCGNLRRDKTKETGEAIMHLYVNPHLPYTRDAVMDRLDNIMKVLTETIVINKAVLDDPELLAAIRQKVEEDGIKHTIRISDEGYVLTAEDYDKLSFAHAIVVDNCVPELESASNIVLQRGVFKYEIHDMVQPVLERRSVFDELVSRNIFHVNHVLSDSELDFLVECIGKVENPAIELDYFDPSYYNTFLTELERRNCKENINIQLIGYLLEDTIEEFQILENYPYEIDVVYSTCHDMVDLYTKEPYTANRLYYSQVEGGGKTSLGNYLNIMEELADFEALAKGGNLSPLEIAILAKIKIDSEFIYDPDYEDEHEHQNSANASEEEVDFWDDTNLSQMLHHEKDGKKRAICVGFATLYSAYCRKCGVPMFRYSTREHMRTIGRIVDEKYGVDTVGASDITWDLPDANNDTHSYKHFMVAPRSYLHHAYSDGSKEFLTIASSFSLPLEDYDMNLDAMDPVESFYNPNAYDPRGYSARLLELMNLTSEEGNMIDFYDIVYRLSENGQLEGIPEETLMLAIENVLRFMGYDDLQIDLYLGEVRINNIFRAFDFSGLASVGSTNGEEERFVEELTPENAAECRRRVWDSDLSLYRPIYYRAPAPEENQPEVVEEQHIEETVPEPVIPDTPSEDVPEASSGEMEPDYIQLLLAYCQDNNISIYSYYRNVANYLRHVDYNPIPPFEMYNPFGTDEDIERLAQAGDDMTAHYFASAMMRTVNSTLLDEEREMYGSLFTNQEDAYLDALKEEMKAKIFHKRPKKSNKRKPTPIVEQTNTQEVIQDKTIPEEVEPEEDNYRLEEVFTGTLIIDSFMTPEQQRERIFNMMRTAGIEIENEADYEIGYEGVEDNDGLSETQTTGFVVFHRVKNTKEETHDSETKMVEPLPEAKEESKAEEMPEPIPDITPDPEQYPSTHEEEPAPVEELKEEESRPEPIPEIANDVISDESTALLPVPDPVLYAQNYAEQEAKEVIEEPHNTIWDGSEFGDGFIPGTDIHRPRERKFYESYEEYAEFLRQFYERYTPNAEYIRNVLEYTHKKHMGLYEYFLQVATHYQRGEASQLPKFEKNNPFLSVESIDMLVNSQDEMMATYFANALMQTVGLNVADFQRGQIQDMLSDITENYNNEISKRL